MEREPAVAGQFYTKGKAELAGAVAGYINGAHVDQKHTLAAISYVAPHAGYVYSGHVAGYTYKALSMSRNLDAIDTFVIVGPNHTGRGTPLSVSMADWKTPLGAVKNDTELSEEIVSGSGLIRVDEDAHEYEHSIEVQLPFLQAVVKRPKCCFVAMGNQSLEHSEALSKAIINGADYLKRNVTVIASSDFDHYEDAKTAERKDMAAIDELKELEFGRFNDAIHGLDDSACGYGPITVAGLFAKRMGGTEGVLLKYSNSGDITKDYKSVVAYSSIVFV